MELNHVTQMHISSSTLHEHM